MVKICLLRLAIKVNFSLYCAHYDLSGCPVNYTLTLWVEITHVNPVVPDLDNASVGNKEKHPRKPALLCSLLLIVVNKSLAVIAIN